ncbi:DNA-binding protein inhibitor ID-4 [Ailuropoda melanoleuca]|nr:DNA-binding protein inhibitor ID-4 [Ailuropoda melanoleuca]
MNDCYSRLRRLVPTIPPNKKVSKVEILQHVIDYNPGPAAGAGDAPGSAEAAAAAGATAPPSRDLSGSAAADPAHGTQHRPGRRGEQAGRQHSVPLSRAVQVCGRLSPSQEH